ncbi:oxidoreductase [Campylobacterota bacterium]|nr:oxidoreductase [Campylobacterota bacterium]
MKSLFDQTLLGSLNLKNRFIRAAIHENMPNHEIKSRLFEQFEKLAKGGVGTIITGFTLVDDTEKLYPMMAFYNDSFFDDHKKLVDLTHSFGAKIILQIVYVGSYIMGDTNGVAPLAPSAVENLNNQVMPKAMNIDEIDRVQANFAAAALRAKNAGYDGVEIHAAHGFLLSQFMTPHYNRRQDIYGGSTENRARMAIETYKRVREKVGKDFQVWIKINAIDGIENGVKFDDVLYLCDELTKGGINAIEISGSWWHIKQSGAYFTKEAEAIAACNKTAVILTGGNNDFNEMTEILNHTDIEYFGLARALAKEPNLINQFASEFL